MSAHTMGTKADPHKARIMAEVYEAGDGLRWRIRSAARGRRILTVSSESYIQRRDAFRGLLLTTGGEYTAIIRTRVRGGGIYEQGHIHRLTLCGAVEAIFVEYLR